MELLLFAKLPVAVYDALTRLYPVGRLAMQCAMPPLSATPLHRVVPLEVNVTVPVGVPEPAVTVAVNVIEFSEVAPVGLVRTGLNDGFDAELEIVVEVASAVE